MRSCFTLGVLLFQMPSLHYSPRYLHLIYSIIEPRGSSAVQNLLDFDCVQIQRKKSKNNFEVIIKKSPYLEYASTIRRPPGIQQIVFSRRNEPLSARREPQTEHATLVQMELILVRLVGVKYLHVRVLHADREPLARGTIPEREDLGAKVVLLQLTPFSQIPASHGII